MERQILLDLVGAAVVFQNSRDASVIPAKERLLDLIKDPLLSEDTSQVALHLLAESGCTLDSLEQAHVRFTLRRNGRKSNSPEHWTRSLAERLGVSEIIS